MIDTAQGRIPMGPHLPKYYAIAQEIIDSIKHGDLRPGMKIPSENQIIESYGVSNTTARKAIQELEMGGWVVKVKAKGTYVRKKAVVRSIDRILSFTKNMIEAGYVPSTKTLYQGIVADGYSALINGRRYSMPGPVFKVQRLRFADDTPMMLEARYISLALCPGIEKMSIEGSLYDIYENQFGIELTEIRQMLSAFMIESGVDGFFNVHKPIPGLLVDGVTFCGREIILEMEKSIYRGDKYSFTVHATQSSQTGPDT